MIQFATAATASRRLPIRYEPAPAVGPSAPSSLQQQTDTDRLGDAIAELAAQIDAATHQLLVMLREFDERNGWSGFRTCAHWLHWRTGISLGAAREKLRVAHALAGLPLLSDAMRRGTLSYSKARALTRIATRENEHELLELAMHGTAAHMERVSRAWQRLDRLEEAQDEARRHQLRSLSLHVDVDGSYVLRGRLDPEVGAVLQRALEIACAELYSSTDAARPDWAQQQADAIGLLAEQALAAFGAAEPAARGRLLKGAPPAPGNHPSQTSPSAPGRLPARVVPPVSGGRANRLQVVLHVDAAALRSDSPDAGMAELESGARVSAETSRRLACDASLVVMHEDGRGTIIDVGRRRRTVPPSLRRLLERRDGGCRFPGCDRRHCDAHHVRHWADGGATSRENLMLLCRFHHRLVHEGGYRVEPSHDGGFIFRAKAGWIVPEVPPAPRLRGDVGAALRAAHAGINIDANTAPRWRGDPMDPDHALRVLRRRRAT
jgi:hypothetical protein